MHDIGKSEVETASSKISEGSVDDTDKMAIFTRKSADGANKLPN